MSKNKFGIPGILFSPTPSPVPGGNVIGGGTAQGGQGNNDLPMDYNTWAGTNIYEFYDGMHTGDPEDVTGGPDMFDYGMWWADCDYSYAQWEALGYDQNQWNKYVKPFLW